MVAEGAARLTQLNHERDRPAGPGAVTETVANQESQARSKQQRDGRRQPRAIRLAHRPGDAVVPLGAARLLSAWQSTRPSAARLTIPFGGVRKSSASSEDRLMPTQCCLIAGVRLSAGSATQQQFRLTRCTRAFRACGTKAGWTEMLARQLSRGASSVGGRAPLSRLARRKCWRWRGVGGRCWRRTRPRSDPPLVRGVGRGSSPLCRGSSVRDDGAPSSFVGGFTRLSDAEGVPTPR
jgi:hypothetical protein